MIVPTNRLLIFVALYLPFLGLLPIFSESKAVLIVASLLLAAIAALDAWLAPKELEGVFVRLPDLVRLSRDREGEIVLQVGNRSQRPKILRIGLPLPVEIKPAREIIESILPAESAGAIISVQCTPIKRGKYFLERYYMETSSKLGLWNIRANSPCNCELRVYPNLLEERKKLAAIFLNRGSFGIHSQRLVGLGREFEKLREYVPGDSYDQIHWKATAKRGRPVTKVFQIERTQEVYAVLDFSRLTARESNSEPVLEQFVKSALILGLVAQQQGDLFGVITFSNKVQDFVRAGGGKDHYNTCRDTLYTLQPQVVTPDYEDLCSFIRLRLRRRALLVVLTDLNDPILAETFVRSSQLIARQHLVMVNMMRPPVAAPLFSQSDVESMDMLYKKLGGHMLWQNLRELENILHRQGIRLTQMDQPQMSAELISQYMSVKQRQIL